MKTPSKAITTFLAMITLLSTAQAAGPAGVWKAEFETQIGVLKYTYTLVQEGEKLTGKAVLDREGEKRDIELKDIKVDGEMISFFETFKFQDNEIRIDYKGKMEENEIKFTRKVGDFATEQIVAKRSESAAPTPNAPGPKRASNPRFGEPVKLGPDDKAAYAAAPSGYDAKREGIAHGKIETVEYESKSVGNKRKMLIYTPPGYSTGSTYPVLYLLHGIGGDEAEWQKNAAPDVILDNLYAEKKLTSMIVIMPNGRAQLNDRAEGDVFKSAPAFAEFEKDLLNDVIPFVESKYPVKKDWANRALAGLSMGGGQSLNFGLGHLDTFGWIGGFSSAPNTKAPSELVPAPEAAKKLKLLWVSCGDEDRLMSISQGVHGYLKEKEVAHIWHVDSGGHTWPVWKNDLYLFSQLLFR